MTVYNNTEAFIYDQTEFGLVAALAAKSKGLTVRILAGQSAFGGMICNGLAGADGTTGLKWIAKQYFEACAAQYPGSGLTTTAYGSPAKNKLAFQGMLSAASITVISGDIDTVTVDPLTNRITSVTTTLGDQINMTSTGVAIDASYTGDLLVKAGCATRYGREAQSAREPLAGLGILSKQQTKIPYKSGGGLMEGVKPYPQGKRRGQADLAFQGWNHRFALQAIADGGVAFTAPDNYDPANYEWFNKVETSSGTFTPKMTQTYADQGSNVALPSYYDMNIVDVPFDELGWVTGTPSERAAWKTLARKWQQGYCYFFANDASVWSPRRDWWASMGFPAAEFMSNGGMPEELYVRCSRRLEAVYMMHQDDCQVNYTKAHPVAYGRHSLDAHVCDLYENAPDGRASGVEYEGTLGDIDIEAETHPFYHIPYESLLPASGPKNVISGGFVYGATHIAQSSIRMTGTQMEIAQAGALAAYVAKDTGKDIADIATEVAAEVAALT